MHAHQVILKGRKHTNKQYSFKSALQIMHLYALRYNTL